MSCHPDPAINAEVALDELRRERDEARAEAARYREALEWYADEGRPQAFRGQGRRSRPQTQGCSGHRSSRWQRPSRPCPSAPPRRREAREALGE